MDSFYTEDELKTLGLKSYGSNVKISRKASIYTPQTISIGNDVRIDDFVCMMGGEKGIIIGSNVHITFFCILVGTGGIIMEDFSGLSSRVALYSATDDYSGESLTNPTVPLEYKKIQKGQIHLGRHVIVGTNSTILPNVTVGEGCSFGAYSLVTKNCDPWGIYVGCPVKRIKERRKTLLDLESEYLKNR
jgi:dTDP-4-amino-4,6-dideoxy-D-glucose acyltransferase